MKRQKLISLRKEYGYSQYDMAKKLNITQSHYNQIENGKKKIFYDFAIKIAKIFHLKPDDIFYIENES